MTGRVDQVEDEAATLAVAIVEAHGLRLDRDPALALDVHGIEDLRLHLAIAQTTGGLNQPVGESRFAVIDVGDDRKVANLVPGSGGHGGLISRG